MAGLSPLSRRATIVVRLEGARARRGSRGDGGESGVVQEGVDGGAISDDVVAPVDGPDEEAGEPPFVENGAPALAGLRVEVVGRGPLARLAEGTDREERAGEAVVGPSLALLDVPDGEERSRSGDLEQSEVHPAPLGLQQIGRAH